MASAGNDNENKTNFLDLNDDCLIEIFKYLNIHETFSLFGCICKRIDGIIYERVAMVRHLDINLRDPPVFSDQQLMIISRNLKSLYITAGYSLSSTLTLNYLKPICCQKTTLYSLTLHYVQFDENFQKYLINVSPQLHFLDLCYCQLSDELLSPILKKCNNLRCLSIFGNYNLRCESLRYLKSKHFKELKVEQNSNCKSEIQKFVKDYPEVTLTIFAIGYLGHSRNRLMDN